MWGAVTPHYLHCYKVSKKWKQITAPNVSIQKPPFKIHVCISRPNMEITEQLIKIRSGEVLSSFNAGKRNRTSWFKHVVETPRGLYCSTDAQGGGGGCSDAGEGYRARAPLLRRALLIPAPRHLGMGRERPPVWLCVKRCSTEGKILPAPCSIANIQIPGLQTSW